jgi:dipeptidyl aminopeptidase/acylaminoacyl peptidase
MVRRTWRAREWRFAARLLLACTASCSAAAQGACGSLLSGNVERPARAVTAEDIIEMREIGYPDASLTGSSPLAVSPDGTRIAFILSRADIATNSYCRALVVVPLDGGKAVAVDTGGEFVSLGNFVRGLWVETGFPKLVTPAWSPDGRSIAVIKREQGVSQARIVHLDGSTPAVSTRIAVDVEDLWWDGQGRLFVATRPGFERTGAAIDSEGQSGWLYDARMAPNYGPRPRIRASDAPLLVSEINPASGSSHPTDAGISDVPNRSGASAVSTTGRRAWLERSGESPFAQQQLWATDASGRRTACESEHCRGRFLGLWWDDHGREVRFLRREGWNQESYALYRWHVGTGGPIRSFATTDVIQNCVPASTKLACTFENSTTPPRIVLVDPGRGTWRTLFDPNPEFSRLRLGTVRRLRVRNDRGLEAWADLVLPPTWRKGMKLPMLLVQYNSRGFLRGGTGNEYSIFPLAAEGFAVLSFERPRAVASANPALRTDEELNAANEKGWAERRSVLSAMLAGVDAAIAAGAVDAKRVGITGLSDGATSVRFALINSKRFSAAAISSCCLEPKTVMTYGGIAWAEFNRAVGYPPATVEADAFWAPMSIALNAGTIRTPLLMQLADDEYLLSLEAFEALREKQAPTEMYIFPGEHHVKWQPRHKVAVFERTADWFSFWLRCVEDQDPAKVEQYRRWDIMRGRPTSDAGQCRPQIRPGSAPTPPRPQGA